MDKTIELLKDADYNIIPTPGAFYSCNNDQIFNINFLNCLTGFSEKTGHFYYITSGTQTDGKLASVLMDSYVEFLNANCNDIAVYFVGRKPEDPSDFGEAKHTMNRMASQLGVHCLSFELNTKPHTTEVT
jgi:hypothetical protein